MRELFRSALVSRGWPVWARYAVTTALVLGAVAVRSVLDSDVAGFPFLVFFPIIILCGVVFDRGNGIYATVLSTAMAAYFLISPAGSFTIADAADAVAVALFAVTGIFAAMLVEALHVAFVDLANSHDELDEAARRRDVLLRELQHRVRNDLAMVRSLLRLQARNLGSEPAKTALERAADRVQTLSQVHQRLSMHGTQTVVDSREFVSELCDSLRTTLVGMRPIVVSVTVESHPVLLDRAVAIGLIINELLTNALKHAFPDPDQPGRVVVEFRRCGDDFCLTVRDNGTGIGSAPKGIGIGQSLVRALTGQLGGRFEVENVHPGTGFVVQFPAETSELPA